MLREWILFFQEWARAFAWGNSITHGLLKILVYVAAVIGLPTVFDHPIHIFFLGLPEWGWTGQWAHWTLGWMLVVVLGALCVLWSGGVAWVRSRVPKLWAETEPITDLEHRMFRLMVRNDGDGILEPNASLIWIKMIDGTPYRPGQLPANLEWTHLPEGTRPRLSWKEGATFAIAYINYTPPPAKGQFLLHFAIEHYRLPSRPNDDLTCCIRISVPGTRRYEERIFRIRYDESAPLSYRCERASGLMSTRQTAEDGDRRSPG